MRRKVRELETNADPPRASESVQELETIRDVFAAGAPDGIGQIRNGVMAGILAELIARRTAEKAEIKFGHITDAEGHIYVAVSMARFRAAFAEVHEALNDALDMTPESRVLGNLLARSVMESIEHLMEKLAVRSHSATLPGDLPDRGHMARRDRSGG